jgi:hypothetical protein
MNRDLYDVIKSEVALPPTGIASDISFNGAIIDTLNYESVVFDLLVGNHATGTVVCNGVYESDDAAMAGETIVPTERVIGSFATLSADGINSVGIVANKRYLRAKYTTASTADMAISGTAILGHPHKATTR